MRTGRKLPDHIRRGVVVEVFDIPPRHYAVTVYDGDIGVLPMAEENHYAFYHEHLYNFLCVRKPLHIDFGDEVYYDSETDTWFLMRGAKLKYNLKLDHFPEGLLQRLIKERIQ